jgi:hypothetical protein
LLEGRRIYAGVGRGCLEASVGEIDGAGVEHAGDELVGEVFWGSTELRGGVDEPSALGEVGGDVGGGEATADHEGEREDASCSVPDRALRVVDKTLGTADSGVDRGAGVGGDRSVCGKDDPGS